jgi:hypothetical protein
MVLLSDPRKSENYALPAMESQKQSNICSATYIHVHAWYVKISPMGLGMSLILILGAACA